jgi:hypothetical protein
MTELTHVFLLTFASGPDCDADCEAILEAGDVFRTLEGAKARAQVIVNDLFEDEVVLDWSPRRRNYDGLMAVVENEATFVIRRVALGA